MPDPIPPAPNPTPTPNIQGYVRPWEVAKIIFTTLAGGAIGFEAIIPILQGLAANTDLWVVDPQYQDVAKVSIGALIAVLSGVFMTIRYSRSGAPKSQILRLNHDRK